MITPIPQAELDVFKMLKDIEIVFDVGARTDIDHMKIKPNATYHLFEPVPHYYEELSKKVREHGLSNAYVNNMGLSDTMGDFHFDLRLQSFRNEYKSNVIFPVATLDSYVVREKITKIDFLKIDTEGWDLKVILGGKTILPNIKYIQYEHWDNDQDFHDLLGKDFQIEYMGYRNSICMNKKLVSNAERKRIIKFIRDNKYSELL